MLKTFGFHTYMPPESAENSVLWDLDGISDSIQEAAVLDAFKMKDDSKLTEKPFTGKWLHNKRKGVYVCAACGSKLFSSEEKFDSGTGWPSFSDGIDTDIRNDFSHGMYRIEVVCSKCSGHLGHLFDDGPKGKRYCINSGCLEFEER